MFKDNNNDCLSAIWDNRWDGGMTTGGGGAPQKA